MTRTSRTGDALVGRVSRPVDTDRQFCADCRGRVEEDLAELYELCTFTVEPGDPGSPHAVVAIQTEVLRGLTRWCRVVAGERGLAAPEEPCVHGLTSFLAIHLDWLTAHPWATAFAGALDELATVTREALRPQTSTRSSTEKRE